MIVFDLRCAQAHVFEAWFASSSAFEEQRDRGLLACPICGDGDVAKAVMAPRVAAKSNQAPPPALPVSAGNKDADAPAAVKAALHALAKAQAAMLENSQWVGPTFAERARAMHDGDEPKATIHGQATPAEAKALIEDGVAVTPLPLPVAPPDALN